MDVDDDLFLVIVADETEKEQHLTPVIKQESLEYDGTVLDDLIETVTRHGEYLDTKLEQKEYFDCEYLEEESLTQISENIKTEVNDLKEGLDPVNSDEDYIPEEYDSSLENQVKYKPGKRKINQPHTRVSFVAKLRKDYPDLRRNQKLLIDTLTEIMRNLKPPPPPEGYYDETGEFLKCVYCGANSDTIPAASRHYQEKHGERYLMCFACGVDFRSTTNLYKHEKTCRAPDSVIVLKARAGFLGRKGRSRPFLTLKKFMPKPRNPNEIGKNMRFPCTLCSGVFYTKSTLASHMNLHRGERPYQCHVCPCAYTSSSALSRHTKKHGDAKFICDHCGSMFKAKSTLVAHMDTHKRQRKFGCLECERRFAQRAAMLLHVDRDHRNLPPPCACQLCPKRYPRMSLLKKHMKKQHDMILITRKMFLKALPSMSALEVEQAKIVLKSDVTGMTPGLPSEDLPQQTRESIEEVEDNSHNDESQNIDYSVLEEFMQYIEENDSESASKTKVFIIQNGQVINLTDANVENSQENLLSDSANVITDIDTVVENVFSDRITEGGEENNVER